MKLTVLYTPPTQVEEFDTHYTSVHLPLAAALPDLLRVETSVVVATPDGSPPHYHRIAELYYADAEIMGASLASEPGRRAAADAMDIAARTGSTVTMLISSLD